VTHHPRKRFGQHFLHDRGTVDRIIAAVAPMPGETIVEIGPGEGVLTEPLLAATGYLHVVEVDRDLAANLRGRVAWADRLRVHEADALRFDFASLAPADGRVRVVGNLPYNVSTPLLFHLLERRAAIADMHFMLQREVVQRMAAPPGSGTYGRLSVMIQAWCHVTTLFRVAPGAFRPPPAVESAVVRLVPREEPLVDAAHEERFGDIVRRAFSARRKTLRNALRGCLDADAIRAAGIDPGARPEQLEVADFARLARC
jgi:16S rRNA (adenine1518-N6/adenine1519-N6)-dimethyltransferase